MATNHLEQAGIYIGGGGVVGIVHVFILDTDNDDDSDGGGAAALRVVAVHCRVPWPRPPASCQPKSPASVNGVPDPGPHVERAGATLHP